MIHRLGRLESETYGQVHARALCNSVDARLNLSGFRDSPQITCPRSLDLVNIDTDIDPGRRNCRSCIIAAIVLAAVGSSRSGGRTIAPTRAIVAATITHNWTPGAKRNGATWPTCNLGSLDVPDGM
jgi:hypothetical protein